MADLQGCCAASRSDKETVLDRARRCDQGRLVDPGERGHYGIGQFEQHRPVQEGASFRSLLAPADCIFRGGE
uniref:Uncharacterized protein n=1 Tax=Arundo donax TaxID=35708 RepID=A0A0A9A0U7_ARUDO